MDKPDSTVAQQIGQAASRSVAARPVSPSAQEDEQAPVATFRTSLRDWQARYKMRRATPAPGSGEAPNQAAPA